MFLDCWIAITIFLIIYAGSFSAIINGRYTKRITNYEIILPRKVKENGAFQSFKIPHYYSEQLRIKRNVEENDMVYYKLYIDGKAYLIELSPNIHLVSPRMILEHRKAGAARNVSAIHLSAPTKHLCHYSGKIKGLNNSRAALSLCSGLTGTLRIQNNSYFLEPFSEEQPEKTGEHLHVIYKRSLLHDEKHCESRHDWWNAWAEEMYFAKMRYLLAKSTTQLNVTKRSDIRESIPRFIEVMIVADKKFIEHHKDLDLEEYILTIMNMVSDYYRDATIGNLIDVVVVRIIYLHKEEEEIDLEISSNATVTLDSFCKWQHPLNPKDPSHPSHHDLAILLTKYDICSSSKAACSLLGLAFVGTVCNPQKNCAINEDNGLGLALTVAHEMGHNMGCSHDSLEESGCSPVFADGTNSIMAPVASKHVSGWTNCSREFINNLLLNQMGECLIDEPQEHSYKKEPMLTGAIYDADQQCKFIFGNDYVKCPIGGDSQCEKLWCKKVGAKTCSSQGDKMADGTSCGPEKWCFEGKCVEIGERPAAVNGGWGDWGPWKDCSRTCGGGVKMRERQCDHPQPQHNGKYCVGLRKEVDICSTEPCPENSTRFRELQCEEHNNKPFRGQLYKWTAHKAPESDRKFASYVFCFFFNSKSSIRCKNKTTSIAANPCALYCKNDKNVLVKLSPRVKDGTRCSPGKKDTCIQGACVPVGCDWKVESTAAEDVCGVCGGDGTHCKIVEDTMKNPDGAGYVKIVTIPKGSVNIKIKELKGSENMLAVGRDDGGQYFNGEYKEQVAGEYKIGGANALYTKPEKNREELFIRGPITEDITVFYTYFKKENPGVTYSYATPTAGREYEPKYQWEFIEWGKCSAVCGSGTQISKPSCVEERDGKVKDEFCEKNIKPEPIVRDCNKHQCKTHWKASKWGPCSGCMYKTGERVRKVYCVMENPTPDGKDGDEIIVDDSNCCNKAPKKKELCNSSRTCGNETNQSNDIKSRFPRHQNLQYLRFLYNLTDVELFLNKHIKRGVNITGQSEQKPEETKIVEDPADISHAKLLMVNLSTCELKNLMNVSESNFMSVGDHLTMYIPEDHTEVRMFI
uniref:Peptidase M12B domain-containing protein n=1 Tax=Rhodnius prolixus TaxID=13249 RepID=T1HAS7_RHOPR